MIAPTYCRNLNKFTVSYLLARDTARKVAAFVKLVWTRLNAKRIVMRTVRSAITTMSARLNVLALPAPKSTAAMLATGAAKVTAERARVVTL